MYVAWRNYNTMFNSKMETSSSDVGLFYPEAFPDDLLDFRCFQEVNDCMDRFLVYAEDFLCSF